MNIPGLTTNHVADAAVGKYRIIKWGSADGYAAQAAASTDALMGVTSRVTADAAGERFDAIRAGLAELEFGGTITRGGPVTSDANGKGVAATANPLKRAVIAGGSAGDLTVTGIATTDVLVGVFQLDVAADTGTSATGDKMQALADLTSEFSITAANTINNTGGTATTGDTLLILYRRPVRIIGFADVSGVSGDIGSIQIAPGFI